MSLIKEKSKTKSLKALGDAFADSNYQLKVLNEVNVEKFGNKLKASNLFPLTVTHIDTLQINMGKMCNQVCKHCHVDAGPDRKEIMEQVTLQKCVEIIKSYPFTTIDLTGGAPEMNPNFRWFVEEIRKINNEIKIIVRCNLTIILANKKYHDLPHFFKENKIEVVSSLPYFEAKRTDAQRGDGVFEKSIKALQMLNEVGYGIYKELVLNLVYNPSGAFMPDNQEMLELKFKEKLKEEFQVEFNQLFAITNLPVSRFLNYLIASDNLEDYMETLVDSYNPSAAEGVMCRNTLSIGWDGYIYDCDFNQMLNLKVASSHSTHINDFDWKALNERNIIINQHCYGCTAGDGSSCGGTVA